MRITTGVLTVLLLAGCTADRPARPAPSPPPSSSRTPSSPPASPSPEPSPSASPSAAITTVPAKYSGGFRTPSGNVSCDIGAELVRCTVRDKPWAQLPAEPGCTDWDTVIALRADTGAALRGECGYGPATGGPPLAYGRGLQVGGMRCVSQRTGLDCLVHGTTRGFFVSRADYRLAASRTPLTTAPAPPPVTAPVTVLPRGFRGGFRTPGGNVVCDVDDTTAHCLVANAEWDAPPASQTCVDGDRSREVRVVGKQPGEAFTGCRTDSLAGGDVLAYGRGLRVGDVQCLSRRTDLECRNLATRHGFSVNRERFGSF